MLTDYTLTARQRLLLFCKEQQPGLRAISEKQKVYTDSGSLYANINASFMVYVLSGERLSMYVENLFDSSDITLSDLDVQITQV